MKKSLLFLFVCLFVGACTPSAPLTELPPTLELAILPEGPSEVTATPNTPRLQPTATMPSETVASEPEEPTAVPATGSTAVPETAAPEIAAPETAVATEDEAVAAGGEVVSGRTEEGAFFLGAPDAPVTHIDYSDFL